MSYNGIGLSTARGSGTNGYIVRNLSALKLRRRDFKPTDPYDDEPKIRKPNADLVLHEQKRSIEVKCATLQAELEDEGTPDDEVERQVGQLRTKLTDLLQKATVAAALAVTRAAEREIAQKEAAEARAVEIVITFAFSFSVPISFSPAVCTSLPLPLPFDAEISIQISFRGPFSFSFSDSFAFALTCC
ncbi:RNA-splicing factor [Mortierella polycephala]|uniref:RNA-splicing factor n=1 Tax=Mortierella polycephala TaxID=41804 RepID=A0A9P6PSF6_9FUNG|nr:RNA-splicing factor [Mortierella polycephala]